LRQDGGQRRLGREAGRMEDSLDRSKEFPGAIYSKVTIDSNRESYVSKSKKKLKVQRNDKYLRS
jgi:hypothetical protein